MKDTAWKRVIHYRGRLQRGSIVWYGLRCYKLAMGRWMSWPLLAVRILSEEVGLIHSIAGGDMRLERGLYDFRIYTVGFRN